MTLKFKNRIALFNTLAVAITTAFVFVVIFLVVTKTAYYHLDNDILAEKKEVFSNLDWHRDSIIIKKMPEWDELEHKKIEVNPTFLQIVDTKGKVVFHSSNLRDNQFLFNPKNRTETFYNGEISKQKIRLGQFPIKNEAGEIIGQLTIATSQQESYSILKNLILVLFISFPLVLIIQFIASQIAASKAIKPVHQLIKTASGISESSIGTRLTLPERKDELYKLTQTINDLLFRIEKSIVQQKQFTSDASHEIRTPLAAIRGTIEILIRKKREPEVYETKLSNIIMQVDRLDSLLEQLLQLARIESGITTTKKEAVLLSKKVYATSEKWMEALSEKKLKLQIYIPDDATVIGDPFYLEIIFDNLIQNAIKYSNTKGTITVFWESNIKTLSFQDEGVGISEEQLPSVFNRFYRTDESRSSSTKGNGLGLSIAKKLADLQNIKLEVRSTLDKGTTFTLRF